MSDITAFTTALTMNSKEIAELVEKRHDNVKRTIETLADQGVITQPQIEDESYKDGSGRTVTTKVYVFTADRKRDTYVVVAQLSPEFTARIVDRWQELEHRAVVQTPAPIPQIELQEREAVLCERLYTFSERCEDPVLRVMLLDRAKNTLSADSQAALPNPDDAPFQTYQILAGLGYSDKEIRSIGPNAGKLLKASYRRLTGRDPEKVDRMVDGAPRPVNVFPGSFREDAQAVLAEWLAA